jgi:5-methylthioadenosine/S-adenosylhomocysteine deaminase
MPNHTPDPGGSSHTAEPTKAPISELISEPSCSDQAKPGPAHTAAALRRLDAAWVVVPRGLKAGEAAEAAEAAEAGKGATGFGQTDWPQARADHSLVYSVDTGRVVDVLPTALAAQRWGHVQAQALPPDHLLMPGLINLHGHLAMSLLRGVADDLPLQTWLQDHIWPLEGRFLSEEFVFDGSLLAAVEAARGGCTTVSDMYFFPEQAASAVRSVGLRMQLGLTVLEFPTPWAASVEESLAKGRSAQQRFADDPLLSVVLAPHAPYTVSDDTFTRLQRWAQDDGLGMHCHVHETAQEIHDSMAAHGCRPLQRLERLGVLGPAFQAVHMVHLSEADIEAVARLGLHVVHNPSSNMKLGSGRCPVGEVLRAGGRVALGSDGAASNNRLDVWTEMRGAALLAKMAGDPASLPAAQALHLATAAAAAAMGRGHELGALAPGYLADMVAIDLSGPECQPVFDPISHLVYVAGREHVRHVWVAGRQVVQGGETLQLDAREVSRRARVWRERIQG